MPWNEYEVARKGRDLLKDYLPGYLGVVERRYTLEDHLPTPLPKGYIASFADPSVRDERSLGNTRVYVISTGLAEDPDGTPEGGYHANFTLIIGVRILNRPKNRELVFAQLAQYLEAVREAIMREGSKVYGVDAVIEWADETTDEGSQEMALDEGEGTVSFVVYLNDVVEHTHSLFPDGPPEDPYEPLPDEPVIDEVNFEVIDTPITEPLD